MAKGLSNDTVRFSGRKCVNFNCLGTCSEFFPLSTMVIQIKKHSPNLISNFLLASRSDSHNSPKSLESDPQITGIPTGYCLRERARRSYVCLAPAFFSRNQGQKGGTKKSCWNLLGLVVFWAGAVPYIEIGLSS